MRINDPKLRNMAQALSLSICITFKGTNLYIFVFYSDGYLNTAPPKDQHKTLHKTRFTVALLITEVWRWSSGGAIFKV